jgi:hypothetical protein
MTPTPAMQKIREALEWASCKYWMPLQSAAVETKYGKDE